MIIREWRGRAHADRAEAYPQHFRATVVPALRAIPGFLGAQLTRRRIDDAVEFLVLTRWQSMDAIRGFAGADPGNAVVGPEAVAALIAFDTTARHYEVLQDLAAS